MPNTQLFLIDAHAICYRSYYAIKGLINNKGQATNAVYGFVSTLKKILRDYNPEYMGVCFDVKGKTHRQKKYSEYKIQRPKMPDDLISQIPIIKGIVKAYNVPIFEYEGFEADDVIGTIAAKLKKEDLEIVIVSDDKDMFQLSNDKIKILSMRKDKMFSFDDIKEHMGISPEYVTDYIALAGDKTDNIPGVDGIGDVSAKKLINQYGSIENIIENIDSIDNKRIKSLILDQQDIAFLSKELALLEKNIPLDADLDMMKVGEPDNEKLFVYFNDLEFQRFASELSKQVATSQFDKLNIIDIESKKEIESLIANILENRQFAFLVDSGSEGDQNMVFSVCKKKLVISLGQNDVYAVTEEYISELKKVFEDPDVIKITYNIKENFKEFDALNCMIKGSVFDVMLAGYLLVPSRNNYDISSLAWQYLKIVASDENKLCIECNIIYQLYDPLVNALKEHNLLKLLNEVEIPLSYVLFCMEKEGITLDTEMLKELSQNCDIKISNLMKDLFEIAGQSFNLNSPKQLSNILFDKLKLPVIKKTKTGYSTNEEVLRRLAEQHPFPSLVLEYRQLAKLKSTYIDALPKLIDINSKKLHGVFNQVGTETGRLSSNNPNLQNIPIRTELGRQIRKAFISSKKDNYIIAADYSQIELRILAHLSQDENLIKAFNTDQDIHQFTAAHIYDVEEKDVTREMRISAKRVNFGIIYGMSAFGLAKDLKITQPQAQDFIDTYFLRYPGVKTFMDNEIKKCEEQGYVLTLLNRRRYIPEINNSNMAVRQFAQRQAINTPVQGSAADLMKLAMVNIHKEMEKQRTVSRMIITVHDELVFDVIPEEQDTMIDLIRKYMEGPLDLLVPIKTVIKKGTDWLDMVEIQE